MITKQQPPITSKIPDFEIDLRKLFLGIWNRKWMVVVIAIIFIGITSFYQFFLKPTIYKSSIILSPPLESTVLGINQGEIFKETKDSLFRRFLEKFTSPEFQLVVFKNKGYLDKLTQDIKGDFDENQVAYAFLKSFKLVEEVKKNNGQEVNFFDPNRLEYELLGSDKNLIQNYLNDLKLAANQEEIEGLEKIFNSRIKSRLDMITREYYGLTLKAMRDRKDRIKIIEEEDNQKITNLLNEKDRLRVKAKQDRLNQIDRLIEAKDIADELGIVENNFKKIQFNDTSTLNLSFGDNQKLPHWYLYGSKALAKIINVLSNRKNNDSFIPRITEIDTEIQAIKDNAELRTLKERESDYPYIERLRVLDVEKARLKSLRFNPEGWMLVNIDRAANIGQPTESKKLLKIAIAGILGVLVGLILIPILNILRLEKEAS